VSFLPLRPSLSASPPSESSSCVIVARSKAQEASPSVGIARIGPNELRSSVFFSPSAPSLGRTGSCARRTGSIEPSKVSMRTSFVAHRRSK
jgi:hypothetical protein